MIRRKEKKEDRNESDKKEEEDEEEDGALKKVVDEGMDVPVPSERKGEADAGGSRGTVAVKLYQYNPQWENVFKWLVSKEGKMFYKWCLAHPNFPGWL